MRKQGCLLLTAVVLAACGSDPEHPPVKPVEETVFRDLARAEDRARSVEATTQQRRSDIDAAVEADEGNASGAD